jgi:hypothetical protein
MPLELRASIQPLILGTSTKERTQNECKDRRAGSPDHLAYGPGQAGGHHNVRYVLGFGLAGVVIGMALIGFLASQGWLGTV